MRRPCHDAGGVRPPSAGRSLVPDGGGGCHGAWPHGAAVPAEAAGRPWAAGGSWRQLEVFLGGRRAAPGRTGLAEGAKVCRVLVAGRPGLEAVAALPIGRLAAPASRGPADVTSQGGYRLRAGGGVVAPPCGLPRKGRGSDGGFLRCPGCHRPPGMPCTSVMRRTAGLLDVLVLGAGVVRRATQQRSAGPGIYRVPASVPFDRVAPSRKSEQSSFLSSAFPFFFSGASCARTSRARRCVMPAAATAPTAASALIPAGAFAVEQHAPAALTVLSGTSGVGHHDRGHGG